MTDIKMVLTGLGMSEYIDRFRAEGFDTWEVAMDITEPDLAFLGVNLAHRRKLQYKISKAWSNLSMQGSYPCDRKPSRKGDAGRPKRAYRHHPKSDLHGPKRPLSAYICFARDVRKNLEREDHSFIQMTRYVGESWQLLDNEKKTERKLKAAMARRSYLKDFESYKQTQEYDDYQQYLAEFKLKCSGAHSESRRQSLSSRRSSSTINNSSSGSLSVLDHFPEFSNSLSLSNLRQVDTKCDWESLESANLREISRHPDHAYTLHLTARLRDLNSSQYHHELIKGHETEVKKTSIPDLMPIIPWQSTILAAQKFQPSLSKPAIQSPHPYNIQYDPITECINRQSYFDIVLQNQPQNGKT